MPLYINHLHGDKLLHIIALGRRQIKREHAPLHAPVRWAFLTNVMCAFEILSVLSHLTRS